MMQPHKYHIHLKGQEKQALRQLKRKGKTQRRLADRARIILWTAAGDAVDEISARLGLHRSTVIFWRQRFVEGQQQRRPVVERTGTDLARIALAFLLFRLFDILKPPPIRTLDARMKNGIGVMVDDLVAAGMALLAFALIVRITGWPG